MKPKVSGPQNPRNVVLWVTGSLVLGLLTWGGSMWVVKKNMFRIVDLLMLEREREKGMEAWVKRATDLHLSYEFVLAHPLESVGKPVVWDIKDKQISWTNPKKVAPGHSKLLGVVRGVAPGSVTLEYLGYL